MIYELIRSGRLHTLRLLHSILNRAINRAMTRDKVARVYIVLSLMTGARRLRSFAHSPGAHVDLDGRPDHDPPIPPSIHVWRSVRAHGDIIVPVRSGPSQNCSAGRWIDRYPAFWFGVGVFNGTQQAQVATGHGEQRRVFAYVVAGPAG